MKKNILALLMFVLLLTSCKGRGELTQAVQAIFPNSQIYALERSGAYVVITPHNEVKVVQLFTDSGNVSYEILVGICGKVAGEEQITPR